MNTEIILVNEDDVPVGYAEKLHVHRNKLLHRAFSIFIFDWTEKKMLLQKRATEKYHSGGLWSNACCSHPRKDESIEDCLNTRLFEELGVNTAFHIVNPDDCALLIHGTDAIYSCGKFSYFADYGEVCENEIDHVFLYSPVVGENDFSRIIIDKREVDELRWVTIEELLTWMEKEPNSFTAWFRSAFDLAHQVLCRQARNLDMFFL